MMRIIRRTLRQWKRELLTFWGRFTAFHRIVIGILLAMTIVFAARRQVLDPLERELATVHKELTDASVPSPVPVPEEDTEIQEETLKAENLQRNVDDLGAELAQVEAASTCRLDAGRADTDAVLLDLASRHDLHVLKKEPAEAPDGGPVPAAASNCELAGRFSRIHAFLTGVQQEPLLWELRDVSLGQMNENDVVGRSAIPLLVLRFTLVQHLYREDAAP